MKNSIICIFSKAILFVLIAAMALTFCSCKSGKNDSSDSSNCYRVTVGSGGPATDSNSADSKKTESDSSDSSSVITVGRGKKNFIFIATQKDGKQTRYSVKTDKKTVGEALLELKMIDGEEGDYGLYVKSVEKTVLDFNKDGYYWAFYVDGEYAQKGIDQTKIKNSSVYELRASK